MEDQLIIQMFFERSQKAISEVENKYGNLCKGIARRILQDEEDVKECINDAWFAVWNAIPPAMPDPLVSFVCRIVKNQALKKYAQNTAKKRNHQYDVALDELEEVLVGTCSVESEYLAKELKKAINKFLSMQKSMDANFFVKRYWLLETVSEISASCGKSKNYVTVHLHRTRQNLQKYLIREGLIQ